MQIGLALTLLMGTKSRERIYGASTLPRRPNMARDYDPPSSGAPVAARERDPCEVHAGRRRAIRLNRNHQVPRGFLLRQVFVSE